VEGSPCRPPEAVPPLLPWEGVEDLKPGRGREFINRIDEIILFNRLDRKHIAGIVDIMLANVAAHRPACRGRWRSDGGNQAF